MSKYKTHQDVLKRLRQNTNKAKNKDTRLGQINALLNLLKENKQQLSEALFQDLGKPQFEATLTELGPIISDAKHTLANAPTWWQPEKVSTPMGTQPASSQIVKEPLGVVLIIAPWNFPLLLLLQPLVGALAAGNCVLLKPSEMTLNCTKLIATLIQKYMDPDIVQLVEGGADETSELLNEKFDKILYTGNSVVGSIVMTKAAKHLTPVALELGGKSPCIVDSQVDLGVAAKRIVNTKFLNAGQVCIAPDYVLVHSDVADNFKLRLVEAVKQFYTDTPQDSKSFGRVINARHYKRVKDLIQSEKQGKVLVGGLSNVNDESKVTDDKPRFIPPTIIADPDVNSKLMQEEIFGPVLPVLTVPSVDEAISFVNQRPKPLALYVFSSSSATQNKVVDGTSSGGVCINDCVYHISNPALPFGGVGASGMGAYHGKHSFDLFSHSKAVMSRPTWLDPSLRYPPFTDANTRIAEKLLGGDLISNGTKRAIIVAGLAVTSFFVYSRFF